MAPRYAEALRSLRAVWLDAGTRDEWYLDRAGLPRRTVRRWATRAAVHFELFDAGHGGIDYRYRSHWRGYAAR